MKSWIEAVALVVAACAMVFSAVQTMVLIRTVDAPYKSNLQDRQIEACVGLIEAYAVYGSGEAIFREFRFDNAYPTAGDQEAGRNRFHDERPEVKGSPLSEHLPEQSASVQELFGSLSTMKYRAERRDDLMAKVGRLRVYSSDTTKSLLDELASAIRFETLIKLSDAINMQMPAADQDHTSEIEVREQSSKRAYLPVEKRCRSIMLGESVGFL
ncbi:hypothetical protein GLP43_07205 [Sulfitobacter sp. M39]|uniref:hypothetical protein n=1 Tax=Sulfitobacter sp. M39 TaxID=2675334 RepID=UPI001F42FCB7|nr:hypothetical protein [Sulfitobacter sp. M39]MCF7747352.1 hypothetical protein [Sulfitobacter sp. M39]